MRILLYGATGALGQKTMAEALARGHKVTAVVRDPSRIEEVPGISIRRGDIVDSEAVAQLMPGHDVLVSAVGPRQGEDTSVYTEAARSLIAAAARTGVRLLVIGGAGSLEVRPGLQVMDTPDFPPAWRGVAEATRDALEIYRTAPEKVSWSYLSPAGFIEPGERTGHYRTGGDQLVVDDQGRSRISPDDLAVALLDEVEHPSHTRQRFTIAY